LHGESPASTSKVRKSAIFKWVTIWDYYGTKVTTNGMPFPNEFHKNLSVGSKVNGKGGRKQKEGDLMSILSFL
jgi:hypothetical protein